MRGQGRECFSEEPRAAESHTCIASAEARHTEACSHSVFGREILTPLFYVIRYIALLTRSEHQNVRSGPHSERLQPDNAEIR